MNELIFNNRHIVDPRTGLLRFKTRIELGVLRVRDITYEVVLGYLGAQAIQELLENRVNLHTYEKQLRQIRSALPREWIRQINKGPDFDSNTNADVYGATHKSKFIPMQKLKSHITYSILRNRKTQSEVCPTVWRNCDLDPFWCNVNKKTTRL